MNSRFLKGAERDPSNMALGDHLRELRKRMFICIAAVVVALLPAWFAYPWLVDFLGHLTEAGRRLLYLRPGSDKDRQLERLVAERATEREGRWDIDWTPMQDGIVTWEVPG